MFKIPHERALQGLSSAIAEPRRVKTGRWKRGKAAHQPLGLFNAHTSNTFFSV